MGETYDKDHPAVARAVVDAAFDGKPRPIEVEGETVSRVDETVLSEIDFSRIEARVLARVVTEMTTHKLVERCLEDPLNETYLTQLIHHVKTTQPESFSSARDRVVSAHDAALFKSVVFERARHSNVELPDVLIVKAPGIGKTYLHPPRSSGKSTAFGPPVFGKTTDFGSPISRPARTELSNSRKKLAEKAARRRGR